jgi:hypothetical protein
MQKVFAIICLGVLVYSLFDISEKDFRDDNLIYLIIGSIGLLLVIFQEQVGKLLKHRQEWNDCAITYAGFHYKYKYPYQYGFMRKRKLLPFSDVDEIRISTYPPTAIVNGNEVIFLFGVTKEQIEDAAEMMGVPITKPQDNWEHICNEFLDTEFDEEWKAQDFKLLNDAGMGNDEILAIRNKIQGRMMAHTYLSWEWVYYGQYDVLRQLWPMTEKKYWWTMEIALRNNTKR